MPNLIETYMMDMSQIKVGTYAENFQFLSRPVVLIHFIDFNADSFLVNEHMKIYIWFLYSLSFFVTMILMRKCSPD